MSALQEMTAVMLIWTLQIGHNRGSTSLMQAVNAARNMCTVRLVYQGQLQPSLVMFGHGLAAHRVLGAARDEAFEFACSGHS